MIVARAARGAACSAVRLGSLERKVRLRLVPKTLEYITLLHVLTLVSINAGCAQARVMKCDLQCKGVKAMRAGASE